MGLIFLWTRKYIDYGVFSCSNPFKKMHA